MDKEVFVERAVVDSILSHAQMLHPREAILLLKGKVDKHKIVVNDTQIPPLATHGSTFSAFPLSRLPIDFSVVGGCPFPPLRRSPSLSYRLEQVLWQNNAHNRLPIPNRKEHGNI